MCMLNYQQYIIDHRNENITIELIVLTAFAILRATNLCLRGSRVKWIWNGHGMDDGEASPIFLTDVVLLFSKSVHFPVTIFV